MSRKWHTQCAENSTETKTVLVLPTPHRRSKNNQIEVVATTLNSLSPQHNQPSNNSSLLTPPLNEKIAEKMQPPSLKRECINFSKISTEEFHAPLKKQLFLGSFPSNEEFDEGLKSVACSYPIRKWKEVPLNQ